MKSDDKEDRLRYLRAVQATSRLRKRVWLGAIVAVMASVTALLLRLWIDPLLPAGFPYLTFFPCVILVTFFFGWRPGLVTAGLCAAFAWFWFIAPTRPMTANVQSFVAILFYCLVVGVDILLINFLHRAAEHIAEDQQVLADLYRDQRNMFGELQHRVANNMQFVSTLLALQKRRVVGNPKEAGRLLDEAQERIEMISRIHRQLYDPEREKDSLGPYLQGLCRDLLAASGAKTIICHVDAAAVPLDLARLTTLSLFVVEVMTNAIKHAFDEGQPGTILVALRYEGPASLVLTVTDDGRGLPPGFETANHGLGWRICNGLARQLKGALTYMSVRGTEVRLVFPA